MKALIILFIGLISQAATSQKFIPDHGRWDQKYHSIAWGQGGEVLWDITAYKTFTTEGISVINNKSYQNLYLDNFFNGYLLTDSLKVWYGSNPDSMWVLFDFGLRTGDIFTFHAPHYSTLYLQSTVSSIDSILIKGEYRKRVKFSDFPGYYTGPEWIEGIGDVNFGGIEPDYSYVVWWGNSTTLQCFAENGENIYGLCTLGIPESESGCNLWPNPTTGILSFELKNPCKGIKADIFDVSGKKVFSIKSESPKVQIDISDLQAGVYFLFFKDRDRIISRKIIKN